MNGFQETFKALSDPIRREILILLKKDRLTVGEICKHYSISNAAISYHLLILKKADLIFESKYKNYIYYEINTSIIEDVLLWLAQFKEVDRDEN